MKVINNYILLEGETPQQWAALPKWTLIHPETGHIYAGKNFFWNGPPPPWCKQVVHYKGDTGKETKTLLWKR